MKGARISTLVSLLFSTFLAVVVTNKVEPLCDVTEEECYTTLVIEHGITNGACDDINRCSFEEWKGNAFPDDFETQDYSGPIGDGFCKLAILYNNSLPGPPIVVYEGQQVVVRLVNNLLNQATTLHWHGLHQRGTPWMDGAGGVSHCSIGPGESFTYRFVASPVGTHWYHSHHGLQRSMGAFGPFIVLPKNKERAQELRGKDPLPDFDGEFYLMVTDWMRNASVDIALMVAKEMVSFPYGFKEDYCFNSTKQSDGFDCGVFPFSSGLINGRGKHFARDSDKVEKDNLDLETFKVTKGGKYRFRVICSSMTFSFRLSIDAHDLHVIASDGHDLETQKAESVIIASGERYDFWIEANDPSALGSYWIRAETLERYQNGKPIHPGHVEAILQYGDDLREPTSLRRECSASNPCIVINCPFKASQKDEHLKCMALTELRSTRSQESEEEEETIEEFLNFHFVGYETTGVWKPSINGYQNILPSIPYMVQTISPTPLEDDQCNKTLCDYDRCMCPHILRLPLGKIVQLVLVITVSNPEGVTNGNSHPVHMHGHSFQVVKVGWPTYNESSNVILKRNLDIECYNERCNLLGWRNSTWQGGKVAGLNLATPLLKDTVTVPIGGYVVVRIKTDNPGYWYAHCHVEFHNNEGMALVIQEGEPSQMPNAPDNFPLCRDYKVQDDEFSQILYGDQCIGASRRQDPSPWIKATLVLAALNLFALTACIGMVCDRKLGPFPRKLSKVHS